MADSLAEVLVTGSRVYFDGLPLPQYIARDGVRFIPGGDDDVNRLRIEFLVGTTTFGGSDPLDADTPIYDSLIAEGHVR